MKKKSKASLTEDDLLLFAQMLSLGYPILDCVEFLSTIQNRYAFEKLRQKLSLGLSIQAALKDFSLDRYWMEYFVFISHFSTLSQAMSGASELVKTKKQFRQILFSQFAYPIALLIGMTGFVYGIQSFIFPQFNRLLLSFELDPSIAFIYRIMMLLPSLMLLMIAMCIVTVLDLWQTIRRRNFQKIKKKMKVPFFRWTLQYYYSLKFASFFSVLSQYVTGLADAIELMYEQMGQSDLMVIIFVMRKMLEMGNDFSYCVLHIPFFHPSFQKYCTLLLRMGRPMIELNNYVMQTEERLTKQLKKISQIMVFVIYVVTAAFIISIYLMILTPMMNIAGNL